MFSQGYWLSPLVSTRGLYFHSTKNIKMNKYILLILLFFVFIYTGIWTFNHFNAWAGIAIIGATILITLNFLKSKIKN